MIPNATWGNWYWPIWLVASLGAFLIAEMTAVITGGAHSLSDNTLSAWVWRSLRIMPNETIGKWTTVDLLIFCTYISIFIVWLPWHLFFRRFVG
jgi:hypothetical protein